MGQDRTPQIETIKFNPFEDILNSIREKVQTLYGTKNFSSTTLIGETAIQDNPTIYQPIIEKAIEIDDVRIPIESHCAAKEQVIPLETITKLLIGLVEISKLIGSIKEDLSIKDDVERKAKLEEAQEIKKDQQIHNLLQTLTCSKKQVEIIYEAIQKTPLIENEYWKLFDTQDVIRNIVTLIKPEIEGLIQRLEKMPELAFISRKTKEKRELINEVGTTKNIEKTIETPSQELLRRIQEEITELHQTFDDTHALNDHIRWGHVFVQYKEWPKKIRDLAQEIGFKLSKPKDIDTCNQTVEKLKTYIKRSTDTTPSKEEEDYVDKETAAEFFAKLKASLQD